MNSSNIAVLIPSYNVGKYIDRLIEKVAAYIDTENILVVNDGSDDDTAVKTEAMGALVLTHDRNYGKGAALQTGFEYLTEAGFEWIITLDGDMQHDPDCIPEFLSAGGSNDYDIIIGARIRAGDMPWDRRFSNWSTSTFLSLITGRKIIDSQSGYRMIRSKFVADVKFESKYYDFEIECILKWIKLNARFGWVNIPTIYNDAQSSIHRGVDTMRFFRTVFRNL